MSAQKTLLDSIKGTIADYRVGEIERPPAEHISRWAAQFGDDVRDKLLTEIDHVLKHTYISKEQVKSFLLGLVKNRKLTGGDAKAFWRGDKLLDIQKGGKSQHEMLSNDRRRQHGVIRLHLAGGAFAREAMRATELLRAKELGSIPGDE